ncbi:low specificity L-threonine aldolase [Neobittarella massiliensis]|uniref:threonine aldolase family protein n=1 Tax=Neobittarella massiliensis (ex Bilen et al. 2018) TaxID=2041842 RepID=UPI000CF69313|nr:aminotransferase class I/II-fold pyridoxal phosphate-dependent enzyme [Neobittarella massiliensis]
MIRFNCDYSEGAHPRILELMQQTNLEQCPGYGEDSHCDRARALIRKACGGAPVEVHFMVGGTQTNLTVISGLLRPHQGVISAASGHIGVHETGAIEATGHKVLTLPSSDGKITAAQVEALLDEHWHDETHQHMVQPGMVYISLPTELGTIYQKSELTALYQVCRKNHLPLYIDGARLGYGLAAAGCDFDLADLCALCDCFYIGGTKQGALLGEALVLCRPQLLPDFRYLMKQRGGMLAKGKLLGLQFEALFSDGLYFQLSRHAVEMADRIAATCQKKGIPPLVVTGTNQLFYIFSDEALTALQQKYAFSYWGRIDERHSAVRICTSWATTEDDTAALCADLTAL